MGISDFFQMLSGMLDVGNEFGVIYIIISIILFFWGVPKLKIIYGNMKKLERLANILLPKVSEDSLNIICSIRKLEQINIILNFMLENLNADRAYVMQFHDGELGLGNIHFSKASCTYEKNKIGILPIMTKWQNLPLGMLSHIVSNIYQNEKLRIPDINDISDNDSGVFNFLKNEKILSCYIISLTDYAGELVGYVGLDFCKIKVTLSQETFDFFTMQVMKICGILLCGRMVENPVSEQRENHDRL